MLTKIFDMKLKSIIQELENKAALALQESYDNSGLIVGDLNAEIKAALICLDSTEDVINEAINKNCNLIIAHHPIVFSGLKSFTGKNYIERVVMKAIKNDIAIYASHTNLDNVHTGVNKKICDKIGLQNTKILDQKRNLLKKLVVFCPTENSAEVKEAIFAAGAGNIGNYDHCSFSLQGVGSFRGNEKSNPTIGEQNELEKVKEERMEFIYPAHLEAEVLEAMFSAHPYEEVAYDLYPISNAWQGAGSGMIGELKEPISCLDFLDRIKNIFSAECIRYTSFHKEKIKKVAVCGGSGSFLLKNAIRAGADIFITADFKYHQFFDADGKIIIADIGHYESEQFTSELIQEYFSEKIPNFATYLSEVKTNPINYK